PHRLRLRDRRGPAGDLPRGHHPLPGGHLPEGAAIVSASTAALKRRAPVRPARILLHVFLAGAALAWLAPLLWAIFSALRPYSETSNKGYVSWPDKLSLENFTNAFTQSDMLHYFGNTLIIAVPAVLLTLFLSSCVAFYVARFDFRLNLALLLVF